MKPFVAACLLVLACDTLGEEIVKTRLGPVAGERLGTVRVFRGIPYARQPVGDYRWRPPVPLTAWEGTYRADRFGPACPQPARSDRRTSIGLTDEACLYLNVWSPVDATEAPVMVWLHGGAFQIGSSSQPVYDGTAFAERGVVLVTANYRLGRLGFFAHPALEDGGGNFGLMDQAAVLRWVRSHVAAFGGNAGNVTVFGESAGAVSVLHLLTSPRTSDLFDRAIVESGGGQQVIGHLTRDRPGRPALMRQGEARFGADATAASLRALPVAELVETRVLGGGPGAVGPVVDGDWVLDDPGRRLADGAFHPVPVMVGANSFEASVLRAFGTTADAAVAAAGVDQEALRRAYADRFSASQAWGDAAFVAGARHVARSITQHGGRAYLYYFDYVLARRRGKVPGAAHGLEVPFVFNSLDRLPMARLLVADADRRMARMLQSYWIEFARSGDPNGDHRVTWPAYSNRDEWLIVSGDVSARRGLRAEVLNLYDDWWRARLAAR